MKPEMLAGGRRLPDDLTSPRRALVETGDLGTVGGDANGAAKCQRPAPARGDIVRDFAVRPTTIGPGRRRSSQGQHHNDDDGKAG